MNCRVGYNEVSGFIVSTVFLGINHNPFGGRPLFFETMVFRQDADGELIPSQDCGQVRYSTLEEARAGHKVVVAAVQGGEIGE
jgi:hypothetical protein